MNSENAPGLTDEEKWLDEVEVVGASIILSMTPCLQRWPWLCLGLINVEQRLLLMGKCDREA